MWVKTTRCQNYNLNTFGTVVNFVLIQDYYYLTSYNKWNRNVFVQLSNLEL